MLPRGISCKGGAVPCDEGHVLRRVATPLPRDSLRLRHTLKDGRLGMFGASFPPSPFPFGHVRSFAPTRLEGRKDSLFRRLLFSSSPRPLVPTSAALVLLLVVAAPPVTSWLKVAPGKPRGAEPSRVPAKQGARGLCSPFRPDDFGGEGVLNGAA